MILNKIEWALLNQVNGLFKQRKNLRKYGCKGAVKKNTTQKWCTIGRHTTTNSNKKGWFGVAQWGVFLQQRDDFGNQISRMRGGFGDQNNKIKGWKNGCKTPKNIISKGWLNYGGKTFLFGRHNEEKWRWKMKDLERKGGLVGKGGEIKWRGWSLC